MMNKNPMRAVTAFMFLVWLNNKLMHSPRMHWLLNHFGIWVLLEYPTKVDKQKQKLSKFQ